MCTVPEKPCKTKVSSRKCAMSTRSAGKAKSWKCWETERKFSAEMNLAYKNFNKFGEPNRGRPPSECSP